MKKRYKIIFASLLFLFTCYVLLDTFVFTKSYSTVPIDASFEKSEEEIILNDHYYKDSKIEISIIETREFDTDIYIADIKLTDIRYLKTAFAKNTYGKNVTEYTSKIALDNQAILAINGDFYGVQEKGYVLRNSIIYRKTAKSNQSDLVIYNDGNFGIINESVTKLESLENAKEVLSFGPALIIDNKIVVNENSTVSKELASNPRTAIAMIDPLHYLFLVSDGRTSASAGLSLWQLAQVLESFHVSIAYNLDGGGSSSFYFNGNLLNNPINKGKLGERKVSDIVYIGY